MVLRDYLRAIDLARAEGSKRGKEHKDMLCSESKRSIDRLLSLQNAMFFRTPLATGRTIELERRR